MSQFDRCNRGRGAGEHAGVEAGAIQGIIRRTLEAQYPVLNWWALLSVLTRAASTVTVILIFVLGTWL